MTDKQYLSQEDMLDNFCQMIIDEYLQRKQMQSTLKAFREESVNFLNTLISLYRG